MFDKLKEKYRDKKVLLDNFISLSILNAANYIFPLITLPYLIRVLGPEKFGLIAFAQALIQYFVVLTDYGFNLSATRETSINREDKQKVSQIFSSVMTIKLFIFVLSFVALTLITVSFDKIKSDWQVYFLTFGIVIGNMLFPVWFFQGMEKMRYITFINIVSKSIFTISIFVFVKEVEDYILVPLMNSLGFIVAGILALLLALKKFDLQLKVPTFESIKVQLKEGWHIFISTFVVTFYRVLPSVSLGIFFNFELVGYFKVGEQLVRALVCLLQPLTQSIFPFISRIMHQSTSRGIEFAFSVLRKLSIITFSFCALIFLFASNIIYYFAGAIYNESILVVRILSFLPFIIGIANILGVQIMLNIKLKREFSYILISGGILSLILLSILVPLFDVMGAAVCMLVTELFIMLTMLLFVYKKLSEIKYCTNSISYNV